MKFTIRFVPVVWTKPWGTYRGPPRLCLEKRSSDREWAYSPLARTPKKAHPVEISRCRRTKPAVNWAARIQIRVLKQSLTRIFREIGGNIIVSGKAKHPKRGSARRSDPAGADVIEQHAEVTSSDWRAVLSARVALVSSAQRTF